MTAAPIGDIVWSTDPARQRRADQTIADVLTRPHGVLPLVLTAPFEMPLSIAGITP